MRTWIGRARKLTLISVLAILTTAVAFQGPGRADVTRRSLDAAGTGWDANEPGLSPAAVTSNHIGLRFDTTLDGQIYAEPLVLGQIVIVATESDMVYGVNRTSGAIVWQRSLGTAVSASALNCDAPQPLVGVTSTPVVDPVTGLVFLIAMTWDGTNLPSAQWQVHALSPDSGQDAAGWPVTIAGGATNDPGSVFSATSALQRVSLAVNQGQVFAGFASFCDIKPNRGWVVGVSTSTSQVKLWTSEAHTPTDHPMGGTWQSGGPIVSDGPGRLFLVTGNGTPPPPGPATTPSNYLGQSVVRLQIQADGSLQAVDRFSTADVQYRSNHDQDLGSTNPALLPDSFGVPGHPHLLVAGSKYGKVFLLDRDNLGGEAQGYDGTDAAVAEAGPSDPVFGSPAVWPGDGGYIYLPGWSPSIKVSPSALDAYRIQRRGTRVQLALVGSAATPFGYGSGSPVVTSNGTTSGSALVWVLERPTSTESQSELRAYAPIPINGVLPLLFHVPLGHTATKFSEPATDGGELFVGTEDGHLLSYGQATPVAGFPVHTANAGPQGITAGGDGNLWFTESSGNEIGRVTPAGVVTEFGGLSTTASPQGIAAGPDGNLWFTEPGVNKIGRMTPAGVVTEFGGLTTNAGPQGIAAGPDGNLWFTEAGVDQIGRITAAGTVTEFGGLTTGANPRGIAAGPDGNLWFTEPGIDKVGEMTPAGVPTEFGGLATGASPQGIAGGPDGNLWFTEPGVNQVGRMSPAGVVTEFGGLTANASPQGIAAGWDGNLWFAEQAGDRIGRISTAGAVTETLTAPVGRSVQSVAAGPDGNMWLTAGNGIDKAATADPALAYALVLPSGFAPASRTVAMGTTVAWLFAAGRLASVTDASGMAAYDSGPRFPGTTFTNQYFAAGTYRYRSTSAPAWTGAVTAAPTAAPVSGSTAATFTLSWASQPAPNGYVYDVYVGFCETLPCTPPFSPWQAGTTAASGAFNSADGAWHGAGTYFFQARLRRTANGGHSLFAGSRLTVSLESGSASR